MDEDGFTALMLAAIKGRLECVERLVGGGAALDLQETFYGNSALHYAAGATILSTFRRQWVENPGHFGVCRVLVGVGASVALRDELGTTPLQVVGAEWAAYRRSGSTGLLKYLQRAVD